MDQTKSKKIETLLLSDPKWKEGSITGQNIIGQRRSANALNLSVQAAQPTVREEALRLLRDKYHIDAALVTSNSFDSSATQGTAVLRVVDNGPFREIEKLNAVRQLASPNAWRANEVTEGGRKQPAQNLRADQLTDLQIEHIQRILKESGISSAVTTSHSLAKGKPEGVRVIRVVGEDNIAKLAGAVPTLEQLHEPAVPSRKASTQPSSDLRS